MKLREASLIIIFSIVAICVVGGITSRYFFGNDNAIEEEAEEIIKEKTGVDIDLSPSTPEEN